MKSFYNFITKRCFYADCKLFKNHYEALGLTKQATHADIKSAYYKLSKIYHPDKNVGKEDNEKFRSITEAYEVIGNPKLRRMYDRGFMGHPFDTTDIKQHPKDAPESQNKPTYSGRTAAYNYDEWTQAHYAHNFIRRARAKARYEEKEKTRAYNANPASTENYVILLLITMVMIFFFPMKMASLDEPNLKRYKTKTSEDER